MIAPSSFLDNVHSCSIKPGYRSDHYLLELNILTSHVVKGRGIWKFNCLLLKNKDYLIIINDLIANEKLFYAAYVYNPININTIPDEELHFTIDDCLFLENLLAKIRGETIKFSAKLKRERSLKIVDIERQIEQLESYLDEENLELLDKKSKNYRTLGRMK